MKTIKTNIIVTLLLFVTVTVAQGQRLTMPEPSQDASITQRLGISDVTITYNSPGARGRKVFGGMIPYKAVWRAGANENTTISFSHDAIVEGQNIKAGTYGLYMVPGKEQFQILFSKFSKSWGSVLPTESEIVLKVSVSPKKIPFQEWLGFNFTDRSAKQLIAVLEWADVQVPFKIEFNTSQIIIENSIAELKGQAGFSGAGHMQLSAYCLQNNTHLDEALIWIEQSIARNKSFSNLRVKADLLSKKGQATAAKKLMEEAFSLGSGGELNSFGYSLLNDNNTEEAIKVFSFNIKKNANDILIWMYIDSLGEAYLKSGNKKMALKYYKKAKEKAPKSQYVYLDGVISGIK